MDKQNPEYIEPGESLEFYRLALNFEYERLTQVCPAPDSECRLCFFGGSGFNNLFCQLPDDTIGDEDE